LLTTQAMLVQVLHDLSANRMASIFDL